MEGEIEVKGSKNAALAALSASLLFKNPPKFLNLPEIEDIKRMRELIFSVSSGSEIDEEIAKRFRASILVVGPLLARFGEVRFPHPGGCVIGARPIDVFLEGWRRMGAEVEASGQTGGGNLIYKVTAKNGLRGCDYTFKTMSVTGTEGMMMTAVLAKGNTVLRNCALEPEIKYLADFLNKNGANISGAGASTINVEGKCGKLLEGAEFFVNPPDRIEAGTLAILGALAAKQLTIKNFPALELNAFIDILKEAGAMPAEIPSLRKSRDGISAFTFTQSKNLRAVSVKTAEYPGFATDLQAPFTVLATQANGESLINETIFEGRLAYVGDLNRMGAKITIMDKQRALVTGPTKLYGHALESPDLRAGLAFVIAALIADRESKIGNIYQIDRGYEKIDERLRAVGAQIQRV